MSNSYMIEVDNLTKNYISKKRLGLIKSEKKVVEALRGVSFHVEKGEIFGLLGPNGAGKTTLIKILTTLLLPTSGTAKVNGFSLEEDKGIKASIGAMLMGERGLYWKLTGRENLAYFGSLYHVPKKTRRERIKSLVDLLELEEFVDRTVETLSSGQKMKMVFARSLINDAPLLMLDEPTNTLDVKEARRLRQVVREHNEDRGKTIVYCTHIMQEADELCHRIGIIDKGQIIAIDDPETLKENLKETDSLSIEGTIPEVAISAVSALPNVLTANILTKRNGANGSTKETPYLNVVCKDSRLALPDIITVLSKNGAVIRDLSRLETTLEDVFLSKTGRSLMDDTREGTVSRPTS
ncbi:MAG: ABC transporter ATP-binding protein [Candidatus Heimdallarchaeota archaeon]